jgi:hypothetical protein
VLLDGTKVQECGAKTAIRSLAYVRNLLQMARFESEHGTTQSFPTLDALTRQLVLQATSSAQRMLSPLFARQGRRAARVRP